MAPFSKAIQLESPPTIPGEPVRVYRGSIDPEWVVIKSNTSWRCIILPTGYCQRKELTLMAGYILALLVEAAMKFQSATTQKDPIHVTAHYLRPSTAGAFEIHVRAVKAGKGFTNLAVDLVQKNTLKVTTHMIFEASRKRINDRWVFKDHIEWTEEPDIEARNQPDHPNRTDSATIGGGGTEWGAWMGFSEKEETISSPAIAFLVDMFSNLPTMLPRSERKTLGSSWFPTVTLSIEFKAPIPKPSKFHASRTVGIYSTGKFMNHPQGRHDAYVEVWTAPTNIGEGEPVEGWRDNQVCLAISTQMALVIPFDEASERADREVARL
ncbi:hypothetical protein NP233_g4623 [Leucocoprinus birnbaumii]|uniref:Thioesterase-like superfamily-domain-containing protein n=1 Tax=Leucocoprinus birnbaumii TaxID=56174 RepID=A0AAD5VUD7_9AGAR|nr:hypothetical protein NP233_g4623 [Leucocoprinus birnbaumii]